MSSCQLMFPGVRSSLESGFGLKPPASGFQSYFYSSLKTSPFPEPEPKVEPAKPVAKPVAKEESKANINPIEIPEVTVGEEELKESKES